MSTDRLRITNTTDGYQYEIGPLRGVDERQTKDALSIAPPGQAAAKNILIGLKGQEADITIRFVLHDDGTDRANGTAPAGEFADDTVVTIAEQREYIRRFVHAPAFDVTWQLDHPTGDEFNGDEVFLERVDIPTKRIGTHSLRKTFGWRVYQRFDLATAQDALGHRDPTTTRRYLEIQQDRIDRAVRSLADEE